MACLHLSAFFVLGNNVTNIQALDQECYASSLVNLFMLEPFEQYEPAITSAAAKNCLIEQISELR